MSEEPVDVLIIGAGASGAAFAWSLAETRMNILCLEQGDWMDPATYPGHARPTGRCASSATSASAPTRAAGARTIPSTTATRRSPVSMFNAVGGSTILYAAHFPRFHPVGLPGADARRRRRRLAARLRSASRRYYDVNARMMGVSGLAGDPAYPPKEVPLPPVALGKLGETLARGLQSARLALVAVRQRDHHAGVRGPRALHQRRHVPGRLRAGREGEHRHHLLAGGAAPGRAARDALPRARDHRRRRTAWPTASSTTTPTASSDGRRRTSWCVACNGIGTPRLLLNSRSKHFPDGLANRSGLVGKNLMFHPYAMVTGIFDEPLEGYKGPTGCCIMSQEFYETDRVARLRARLLVRDPARLRAGVDRAVGHAARTRLPSGAEHHRAYAELFDRTAGMVVICEDLPEAEQLRDARSAISRTPTASRRRRSPIG